MNQTIWKYKLEIVDEQFIEIPFGYNSKLLSVAMQDERLCLWAIVEPEKDTKTAQIRIFGTGNPHYSGSLEFLGTVQEQFFVWHVFGGIIK